ncbi:MAG: PIN domain-containing protein [Bacteroidales bacterium]|nr:PIN domain-containing protein [Bacteroidales bacterium]
MKVFLDTNVIIDYFDRQREHYQPTAILFDLAMKGKLELVVCTQSFITAFYLLGKYYPKEELYTNMRSLYKICGVSPVDASIIEKALSLESVDFEDTVQYLSATTTNAEVIITRDKRGFKDFPLEHISAEQFLDKYLQ